ncbi:MAG TPA: ester cyclase [Ardenticatenaceae bacterium]|nr:ester cyclase [Ardenticatenaceae bacterium]
MSAHTYHDLIEEAREKFNAGDMEGYVKTVYAENALIHYLPPGLPQGWEGAKLFYTSFAAAFPDVQLTFDDIITEGDRVAIRYHAVMTHLGEFQGIPPTGKRVTLAGITILRFAGGKVVERWSESDFLGMLQQLGVIPAPGQGVPSTRKP